MINSTLFKKEMKKNLKILIIFLALITLYATVIVAMFDPELSATLDAMAAAMPEVFAAVGMNVSGDSLIEFIGSYLYGFILLVIPVIFILMLSNKLVARYVDKGSMAYLLATPNKRLTIVTTQLFVLVLNVLIVVLYTTFVIALSSYFSFPGELNLKLLIYLNIGLFCLLLFLGSICFLSSCLFNESKNAIGDSGGIVIFFILIQMLSQVGDKFDFLKYFTPLTLFNVEGILLLKNQAFINISFLFIASIILYTLSIKIFTKKDLPI